MLNIMELMKENTNLKRTENGAITNSTSKSDVLDYFAQGSAMRNRLDEDKILMFCKAFFEDPLLAMKILFYSRDVRGGQGERDTFRTIINHLAKYRPDIVRKNLHLIPEFGRWDDLFCLLDTPVNSDVIKLIATQLKEDLVSENPSLLGKWMKSENTSSEESRVIAKKLRKGLKMSPRDYRKTLSLLRDKISIVETKLSKKTYSLIKYDKLPSGASLKYRKAFERNDYIRYSEYVQALAEGKTTVNAKTLYPYELVRQALECGNITQKSVLDSMWKALPDYVNGSALKDVAVIDVSGSMFMGDSLPIYNAISLGLYLAERCTGIFKNHFITFSSRPQVVEIKGDNLVDKVNMIRKADWGYNTNIKATFDLILNIAESYNLPQEALPDRLIIISDMEFDSSDSNFSRSQKTLMKRISDEFKAKGYKMPKLVFWNVNSRQDNIPMRMDEEGVQLVSGSNPMLFEALIKGEMLDAYALMMSVIGKPRYDVITI